MRPPMNQTITFLMPEEGKDDYGRPITYQETVKARVQQSSKIIESTDGTRYQSVLEVDIMPNVPIVHGAKAIYEDPFENSIEGSVLSIEDSLNLSGKKVFFRTIYIG